MVTVLANCRESEVLNSEFWTFSSESEGFITKLNLSKLLRAACFFSSKKLKQLSIVLTFQR